MTAVHAVKVADTRTDVDSQPNNPLAKKLRSLRLKRGWTQKNFLEKLLEVLRQHDQDANRITQSAVSKWENGRSLPKDSRWFYIEQVYELPPGTIRSVKDGTSPPTTTPVVLADVLSRIEQELNEAQDRIATALGAVKEMRGISFPAQTQGRRADGANRRSSR